MKNTESNNFDVIIVGGSYAGLSAAMALGRSLRKVLIIDSGSPCNQQTPHSHNFITQDGKTPTEISAAAKSQVLNYDTVIFLNGLVTTAVKEGNDFIVGLSNGQSYKAKKLLFATGLKDLFPDIKGFAECWGITVLHCPYCHGYEVKHEKLGVVGNGDLGFEFVRLISNWSQNLTLYTNGKSTLSEAQTKKIEQHTIKIVEKEINHFEHDNGLIQAIAFKDRSKEKVTALFARGPFKQHCEIPEKMGCEIDDHGFLKIDDMHRTKVPGVYAAGDNTNGFRAVSIATAAGTKAGAVINKDLIDESF